MQPPGDQSCGGVPGNGKDEYTKVLEVLNVLEVLEGIAFPLEHLEHLEHPEHTFFSYGFSTTFVHSSSLCRNMSYPAGASSRLSRCEITNVGSISPLLIRSSS